MIVVKCFVDENPRLVFKHIRWNFENLYLNRSGTRIIKTFGDYDPARKENCKVVVRICHFSQNC